MDDEKFLPVYLKYEFTEMLDLLDIMEESLGDDLIECSICLGIFKEKFSSLTKILISEIDDKKD